MSNRYLNYMHLPYGPGHVTCAIDHPVTIHNEGIVHVGLSFCSPRDVFVKARGREKAVGRLRTGGTMTFSFTSVPGLSFKRQVSDLLQAMRKNEILLNVFNLKVSIPKWAKLQSDAVDSFLRPHLSVVNGDTPT